MADRVGVINKGEIILVEDKAALMRKLGKKQLTLQLQQKLDAVPPALAAHNLTLAADGTRADLQLRHAGRAHRHHRAAGRPRERRHPLQGPAHDAELARGDFRRPGEAAAMNLRAVRAIYAFEMARTGRTLLQSIVSPVISTSLYFVVFGAAIGSRITEIEGVELRRLHRAGADHADAADAERRPTPRSASISRASPARSTRLLSAPVSFVEIVLGYVGAAATKSIILGLIILATAGLFVPLRDRASGLDDRVPGAHRGDLQPARLHHRHLGRRLREAAGHPAAGDHAADLPRRQLLFDQRAAAGLADRHAVQSRWSI